ncbi:MAG: divergent polysaccharide deacetylase family protein [Candidatus Omnitrophica bacterium]|nr:divergent polysaccharide deacetylase family protein [Candidatus Omnitrophota bacterium]
MVARTRKKGKRKRFVFRLKAKTKKKLKLVGHIFNFLLLASFFYLLYESGFLPIQRKVEIKPSSLPTIEKVIAVDKSKPLIPLWKIRSRKVSLDKPKIAFVIDDIGNTLSYQDELVKLGDKVTYAILPMLPYSRTFSRLSQKTGAEVILHLPLEAADGTIPGPGLITDRMPESQVLDVLNRNLISVSPHVGVNNHMGSLGSKNPKLMGVILQELKDRGLFYLDSYTTSQTTAVEIGSKINLPVLTRSVFLDNQNLRPSIEIKIAELAERARKHGYAIGIGHYRPKTLRVLQARIPELINEGFEIISLSDLVAFQYSD